MRTKLLLLLLFFTRSFFLLSQKDSLFQVTNLSIDSMGNLRWIVHHPNNLISLQQDIQYLKGAKWESIGGPGTTFLWSLEKPTVKQISQDYFTRVKFHKGINTYRIRIVYPGTAVSEPVQLVSKVSNDDGSVWIMGGLIFMEQAEYYEILDQVGKTLLKGTTDKIDISSLPKGSYFLYTKTSTKAFTK